MSGGRHTSSLQFPVCVWFGPRRQADADSVKYTFRRLCCRQFLCRPHPWFGGLVVGFSFPDTVCACCVIFAKSQWYLNSYKVLCVCVCLCVTSQCMLAFASSLVNPPPFLLCVGYKNLLVCLTQSLSKWCIQLYFTFTNTRVLWISLNT